MNEEEIINILTDDIVALNVGYEKYEEAVQGLLDLYNKEKERNKDLEQIEKEHKEENGMLREELENIEYIKRNFDYCLEQKIKEGIELKVKEKIEEYNKMIDATFKEKTCFADNRRNTCMEIIHILQELLEESD